MQRGLAAKLQDLSATFRKKQRVYLESACAPFLCPFSIRLSVTLSTHSCICHNSGLQGHAIKNQDLLIASGTIALKGQEGLSAVDEDLQAAVSPLVVTRLNYSSSFYFVPYIKSQSQVATQEILGPDFRMRDRELTEIAKSIASLAELFKDLSSMVIDQGTLLDSIEYNIEQTSIEVSQAVKELDVATRFVFRRTNNVTRSSSRSFSAIRRTQEDAAVYFYSC